MGQLRIRLLICLLEQEIREARTIVVLFSRLNTLIGGFSMSRSKWLISFVIDLSTYERFLERLTGDINKVAIMTDKVLNAAYTHEHSGLRNDYKAVLES